MPSAGIIQTGNQIPLDVDIGEHLKYVHAELLNAWRADLTTPNDKEADTPDLWECGMPVHGSIANKLDLTIAYSNHSSEPQRYRLKPNPRAVKITGLADLRGPILLFLEHDEQVVDFRMAMLPLVALDAKAVAPVAVDPKVAASKQGNEKWTSRLAKAFHFPLENVVETGPKLVYYGANGEATTCIECDAPAIFPITGPGLFLCATHQRNG
jgi:hypothetical protein